MEAPYPDKENKDYDPQMNGPNVVRKVVWLESPMNSVYLLQDDAMTMRRPLQEKRNGPLSKARELIKNIPNLGERRRRVEPLIKKLNELFIPLNPSVQVDSQLRIHLESMKRSIVAEILLKREQSKRQRDLPKEYSAQRRAISHRVSREYAFLLNKYVPYNDGYIQPNKENLDNLFHSLKESIAVQTTEAHKRSLSEAIDALHQLIDLRDATLEFSETEISQGDQSLILPDQKHAEEPDYLEEDELQEKGQTSSANE